LMEH